MRQAVPFLLLWKTGEEKNGSSSSLVYNFESCCAYCSSACQQQVVHLGTERTTWPIDSETEKRGERERERRGREQLRRPVCVSSSSTSTLLLLLQL